MRLVKIISTRYHGYVTFDHHHREPHLVLERIAGLFRAEQRRLAALVGLSVAQLEALHFLDRCNRYSDTPAGVAEYLGATKGTVSQSLAALEQKDLITKLPDPHDGRLSHCQLTSEGRSLVKRTTPDLFGDVPPPSGPLVEVLRALQSAHNGRTFGQCASCRHLERGPTVTRCGLTGDPLTEDDVLRICREHEDHGSTTAFATLKR